MSFDVAGTVVKVGDVVAALTDGGYKCITPYRYYKVDYVLQHGVGILDEFTRKSWFMTPDEILLVKQEDEIMRLEQNETVAALREVVRKLDEMLVVLKGTDTASELDEEPKRVAMPDWKEGDKVRCLKGAYSYREGEVYEVGYCRIDVMAFGVLDADGDVMFHGRITSDEDGCSNDNILDYFELLEEAQEVELSSKPNWKAGDKVQCLKEAYGYVKGEVYKIGYCRAPSKDFGVLDSEGIVMYSGCLDSDDADFINENIEEYFELVAEEQDTEKAGRSVKFKAGDKVRIRNGFDVEEHNARLNSFPDELYFNESMSFDGVRTVYSVDSDGEVKFEGSNFYYTDSMLELA